MTRRIMISSALVLVLCLYGCSLVNGITKSTPAPRSIWLTQLLENPVCQPPCWNNITPAQTTMEEANEILKADPTIRIIETNPIGTDWEFIPNGGGGYVEWDHKKKTIDFIHFEVSREQSLTLADVIGIYSEPTSIFFEQDMHNLKMCLFFVFYDSYGLAFSNRELRCKATDKDGVDQVELIVSPDTILHSISMIATGARFMEYANSVDPVIWTGYGNYVREYGR